MHIQDRPYTTIHMYIKIEHNRGGGRTGEMPLATTGKVWRAEGGMKTGEMSLATTGKVRRVRYEPTRLQL